MESWDDEQDEAHQKPNLLHPLAAVKLVVDEEGCKVVSSKRAEDVDQIPEPSSHDGFGIGREDLDELGLEQFVSVEENIITVPTSSGGENTATEVSERHPQRLYIVTGDVGLLLGHIQLLGGQWHLVPSVVDEPESTHSRDGK